MPAHSHVCQNSGTVASSAVHVCLSTGHQPRPLQLSPLPCTCAGVSSSCEQARNQPALPHACQGRRRDHRRAVRSGASACGSEQTLSSLAGPHHCAHLQPASPAALVPAPSLPLSSHAHGSVPAKGEIGQLQESRLTVGAPRAASEPVVGPRPSCLPWLTPLCRCMQPALATTRAPATGPAAECVHTAGSSHHCCLPWSLAGRPEVPLRIPAALQPLLPSLPILVLPKDHTVVDAMSRNSLSGRDIIRPGPHPEPLPASTLSALCR